MQFYTRARVYFGNTVYHDVPIGRFICCRLNPNVPPETHRTFSLLPHPLVPYSPYALNTTIALAATLAERADNAYQTSQTLASTYEHLNPDATTLRRLKGRLLEALHKLKCLPEKLQQMISPSNTPTSTTLADLMTLMMTYRSQVLVDVSGRKGRQAGFCPLSGACALCHDWFFVFQAEMPYMERDFLVGTPSQKRRAN